jgi:hypothetical protein
VSDFQTLEEVLGKDEAREGAASTRRTRCTDLCHVLLDGDNNMAEVQDLLGHRRARRRATSWCLKAHRRPDGQSQPLGYGSGLSPAQQRFGHLIGIGHPPTSCRSCLRGDIRSKRVRGDLWT